MRQVIKRLVLAVAFVPALPAILLARLGIALQGDEIFCAFACLLSLLPGKTGSYVRLAYYKGTLRRISSDVMIGFGSFFSKREAEVGRNVAIGSYCVLGHVVLGDESVLASRVSIPSGKRQHALRYVAESPCDELVFDRVNVGKGCWIGEGAIILADVGDCCIVSAGGVVTAAVPPLRLVAGNPARVVRDLPAEKTGRPATGASEC